jgi:hypothetical protein
MEKEFEANFEKLKSYYSSDPEMFKVLYDSMCADFDIDRVNMQFKKFLKQSFHELDDKIASLTGKIQFGGYII